MGRIADALERAEQRRSNITTDDRGGTNADPNRRWASWFGNAQARDTNPVFEHNTLQDMPATTSRSEELVSFYDRASLVSEQYRSFRTRLLSSNPQQEHRIYVVTSAVPREGKTVTTVNLGFSLAEIRHLRVLVVDGDFRRSSMGGLLGHKDAPGFADLAQNKASYEEIIRPTQSPNLFYVPAGKTAGRSAPELLSTRIAKATFQRFQKEFHYTIIDTPPATTVADVGIIGQMAFGAIFLIRMHRTPEPLARRAVKLLLANNVNIVGSVVIGEDDPSSGYGHRYDYDRYYKDEK